MMSSNNTVTKRQQNLDRNKYLIQVIQKDMADRGVRTDAEYAQITSMDVSQFGSILRGDKGVSPEMVLVLAKVLKLAPIKIMQLAGQIDQTYFEIPGDGLTNTLEIGWAGIQAHPRYSFGLTPEIWDDLSIQVKLWMISRFNEDCVRQTNLLQQAIS
jgi:plasmid maintenance system antidote protein VapI